MAGRARTALLAAAALVAAATACAGSDGDKAGGTDEKPLVFTLESEDDVTLTGAPEFAEAVERLSGGSLRIELVPAGRGNEVAFEKGVVEDVRGGKAQLGLVGVPVWDTLGVTSFQPLLAPMLVDSYELERRVLESSQVARMLEGAEQAGVVGIALLPGPLRRPLGISRVLRSPEDYRGATVGNRVGRVAVATLRALGAAAKGYVPGDLAGLDGVESDPKTVAYNGWRGTLTTNVVLWPKPYSIVMNRVAYEALSDEQRQILKAAGLEALGPELSQTVRDEEAGLAERCRRGLLSLAAASSSDLAELRQAVQPVYDELERDAEAKERIDEIRRMRGEHRVATPSVRCAGTNAAASGDTDAAKLNGRWRAVWTRKELLAAGVAPKDAAALAAASRTGITEFEDGRLRGIGGGKVLATGTYTVDGNVISMVFDAPAPPGVVAGRTYQHRWSRYRDSLSFSAVPGSEPLLAVIAKPFTRVR